MPVESGLEAGLELSQQLQGCDDDTGDKMQ